MTDMTTKELPPLVCNGCRKCCLGDTIMLLPIDNPARYKTRSVNGGLALAHNKAGNCVYLGKSGCQIQTLKPFACRNYDCRKHALAMLGMPDGYPKRLERPEVQEGLKRLREAGVISS